MTDDHESPLEGFARALDSGVQTHRAENPSYEDCHACAEALLDALEYYGEGRRVSLRVAPSSLCLDDEELLADEGTELFDELCSNLVMTGLDAIDFEAEADTTTCAVVLTAFADLLEGKLYDEDLVSRLCRQGAAGLALSYHDALDDDALAPQDVGKPSTAERVLETFYARLDNAMCARVEGARQRFAEVVMKGSGEAANWDANTYVRRILPRQGWRAEDQREILEDLTGAINDPRHDETRDRHVVKLLDQLIPEADLPLDALLIERAAPILRQLENSPVAQVKAERASRFYLGSLNACLSLGNLEVMAQVAKLAMPADGPEPIMEVAELVRAGIGRRDELEALLDVACEMAIELNDGGASEHLSAIVEGLAPQPLISVMVERFMYVEDEARGMLKAILEQKAGADLEALLPLINARSTSFIELGFELLGAFGERGRALIELYLEDGRVVRRRLALKTLRKVVSPNLDAWRAEELRKLESRRRSERLAALSRITCLENDAEAESALLELISAPDFSQRDVDEIERFLCALAMMSPDQGRAVVEELATQRPAGDSAGRKRRQAALRALEHLDELQAGAAASREESTS